MIRAESNGHSDDWIMREHKHRLTAWLKDLHLPDGETMEEQQSKDWQRVHLPRSHHGKCYDINGYLFYTAAMDKKTVSQNSGVRIAALDERIGKNTTYFGVIEDIREVHYGFNIQIPVFRCRWVKHPKGVEVDAYGLTIVDLNNIGYKDDQWVLASQVTQVLYVAYLAKKTKHVVVPEKQDIIGVEGIDDVEEYNQYDQMNLFTNLS